MQAGESSEGGNRREFQAESVSFSLKPAEWVLLCGAQRWRFTE